VPRRLSKLNNDYSKGYFDPRGELIDSDLESHVLKEELRNLRGFSVSKRGKSIILDICSNSSNLHSLSVIVGVPGREKERTVSFREIIDADKIIRYHLKNGEYPISNSSDDTKCDYRNPNKNIGVLPVRNNSYAPRLAELIRERLKERNENVF